MILTRAKFVSAMQGASSRWLPFADTVSEHLSLARLLRLALFQVSVGMTIVLLSGTLNRIMVVEMGMTAVLVSMMVAVPLLLAPLRALIGFRSDNHRSYLGWRRVPYLWGGTLMQFGGLAIMPFALILMVEPHNGPDIAGPIAALLSLLLLGLGMHTVQTAGLALATDLASPKTRANVVALLYTLLLVGTISASAAFAWLLQEFDYLRLIKVLQGSAVIIVVLNVVAMWKQEARQPHLTRHDRPRASFGQAWHGFIARPTALRLLVGIALGTVGFSMQDILLEPYGAEILGMSVSETTLLTGIWAVGMLLAFVLASRWLRTGWCAIRVAAVGGILGICAFSGVIFAGPLDSSGVFWVGVSGIGFGAGLFSMGTLAAVMADSKGDHSGLALGAWGAVTATSTGVAVFTGGALRDGFYWLATKGHIDPLLDPILASYGAVYHLEILFLFAALVALGPVARLVPTNKGDNNEFLLADFPA
jgi:BCD family chlorophyll transporter-like MFS transporter